MTIRLLVVAADGDRTVGVVKHVVADAAQYRPSYEAETSSAHHDHRCLFHRRQLHDRFSGTRAVPDHDPSAHLYMVRNGSA